MTQKQSDQPSKIVMLAPIAIVLVVYSFVFLSPQQTELRAAQARFDSLSESHHETEHQISDIQFDSKRTKKQLRELASQIDQLQQTQTELLTQRRQMLHQMESHSLPAATMQQVTRLMKTHRLRVIESQPDSGAANQVEKALKSVRDLLSNDNFAATSGVAKQHQPHHSASAGHKHFAREVYKLKVRGRFQDLQSALEKIVTELDQVLPLSLQMEPLELDSTEARQSQRTWTLTIMV